MRMPLLFTLSMFAAMAMADFVDEAQNAARAGSYDEVVEILDRALESDDLSQQQRVYAWANRGIAWSLLGRYERARDDLGRAIDLDPTHALSLNHLGILAEHADDNPEAAAVYYRRAADSGFAAGQVNLADLYRQGKGVEQDYVHALSLYRQASNQGYPLAWVPMGRMYKEGLGVDKDSRRALNLFVRAAQAGAIEAHYYLGVAYEHGEGVPVNKSVAAQHYEVAAMQGHGQAQNALGHLYRNGEGVGQDYMEAVKWYRLSADQGVVQAMNRLAWLLATCPTEAVCNGSMAVELAEAAVEQDASPGFLDSLAAAYARTGQYDRAIATLERALTAVAKDSAQHREYRQRLRRYQRGVPYQL